MWSLSPHVTICFSPSIFVFLFSLSSFFFWPVSSPHLFSFILTSTYFPVLSLHALSFPPLFFFPFLPSAVYEQISPPYLPFIPLPVFIFLSLCSSLLTILFSFYFSSFLFYIFIYFLFFFLLSSSYVLFSISLLFCFFAVFWLLFFHSFSPLSPFFSLLI